MPAVPVLAVPMLHAPEPEAGGAERDEASWAVLIDSLRPRLLELKPRELCDFCQETYYHDLVSIVISAPYSEAVLARLKLALSEPVFDMLDKDCQDHGPSQLAAELAYGTFKRMDALLVHFANRRATPEQIEQLTKLAREMATLDETLFKTVLDRLKGFYLEDLLKVSESADQLLSRRLREQFDDGAWNLLHDRQDNPVSREDAEEAIAELPIVFTGKEWQSPEARWRASEEGQRQQREFDAFMEDFDKQFP